MKCPNCGERVVRYPIKDKEGKLIWINLFKTDLMSILFIIIILFMVWGYKADIEKCDEVLTSPCSFCEKQTGCVIDNPYSFNDIPDFKINITEENAEANIP